MIAVSFICVCFIIMSLECTGWAVESNQHPMQMCLSALIFTLDCLSHKSANNSEIRRNHELKFYRGVKVCGMCASISKLGRKGLNF